MESMRLRGIYLPLTTPFDAEGRLVDAYLRENLDRYAAHALAGYVILGSTGEAILLEREEKQAVLQAAARAAYAQKRVLIAGTAEESFAATLAMNQYAAGLGYDLALVRTPHYYKNNMTAAALTDYYLRLADASPIPILVYNFPQLTGLDITVDTVTALARHERIAGIKESSGNLEKISRLLAISARRTSAPFTVLPGNAATLWPALAAGVEATILALGDVIPAACAALWQAGLARDWTHGLQRQQRIMSLALASAQGGVPAIKAAMDLAGFYGGPPRLPLQPLPAADRARLAAALAEADPAFPAGDSIAPASSQPAGAHV